MSNFYSENAQDWIGSDCRGQNFYSNDKAFQALTKHYLAPELFNHLEPHFERLGELAGGELDELARVADRHGPVLHMRDHYGRDKEWIEYHPAYREMEKIAYDQFGFHAMSYRGGVLGWPDKIGPVGKYALSYLYVQGEFGLMCPISLCDTSAFMVDRYASPEIRDRYLPRMIAETRAEMSTGTQFMTEQVGGSDVANLTVEARQGDGVWRIYGDKWFCSHTDSDLIVLLARTEKGGPGSRGLSLFLVPRELEDGSRNNYRILRLKDKMGTRSMATGEVTFQGSQAYLLGEEGRGIRQVMDQVSLSRLSHGVRAAAQMRRCYNEALTVAKGRQTFGKPLLHHPLMRRQLMKIMVPTEQALSAFLYTAHMMEKANAGDPDAAKCLRILTPLIKFRTCRDNIPVATAAMEARGGNGFIDDFVNPRLVRDAHTGVLWEGTSSIVALDVTTRAIPKELAHEALGAALNEMLDDSNGLPGQFKGELSALIDRAVAYAGEVAASGAHESFSRQATNSLYHIMTASLLAREGAMMAADTGDARRLLLSRLVIDHRLRPQDPMSLQGGAFEEAAGALLLSDKPASLEEVNEVLTIER